MAKLYWRIKKNGKWTWMPAVVALSIPGTECTVEWFEEEFE